MKVTFDSEVFLEDLFKRALKIATTGRKLKDYSKLKPHLKLSIGIDIVTYGSYNAKMAFIITNESCGSDGHIRLEKIQMFEDHIGNLRYSDSISCDDIEFIKEFKSLISKCFECFGKRWYELSKDVELKVPRNASFKLVEQCQFAMVYFDELRCFSINQIICKFFQTMLKCLCIDITPRDQPACFKNLCVTIPSDFHSYQRLTLKNCLHAIGISNFILVNKSTSLALPFLAKNLDDSTQKFIVDFGSGYMNCSIVQLIDQHRLEVRDQLADKNISSRQFFLRCYNHLKWTYINHNDVKKRTNGENNTISSEPFNALKFRHQLYKVMNEQVNSRSSRIKETWSIPLVFSPNAGIESIDLNMKRIGVEQFVTAVIEKLKRTSLIENGRIVSEISDILICSDAVIYEYLEPLLANLSRQSSVRSIRFMDNDCACLGAAYLASQLLRIRTHDMLPYPIGIGLYNGVVKTIIPAKVSFPCNGKHIFQTIVDNQTTIRVNLYEGQSRLARSCKHICEFIVADLREALSGEVKIEIEIELDQNGLLNAWACDNDTRLPLCLSVDLRESNFLKFKRDTSLKVNIDSKMDAYSLVVENYIGKYLDDFEYYFEYLIRLFANSPNELKAEVEKQVTAAKTYISRNRFRIDVDQCDQLKSELDSVVLNYRAINPEIENRFSYRKGAKMGTSGCFVS